MRYRHGGAMVRWLLLPVFFVVCSRRTFSNVHTLAILFFVSKNGFILQLLDSDVL
jgi:hypothetical protein